MTTTKVLVQRRALQLTAATLQILVNTLVINEDREILIHMPDGEEEYLTIGQVLDIADDALEPKR